MIFDQNVNLIGRVSRATIDYGLAWYVCSFEYGLAIELGVIMSDREIAMTKGPLRHGE